MLKVIELFAGIGSQHQALKNIRIEHEIVAISEIDKYCIQSYEALHGKCNNLGDICKIERLPQADLWTYSFPCTDISIAGKLAGITEETRSGLLLQVERLLKQASVDGTLPKYLLLENVKNLVSKRFKNEFNKWLEFLEQLGYTNYWQILNAKDYGIPQNRERVFCVSIRGEHSPFYFPQKQELKIKLKDLLEDKVDEKYYLSQKMINCFLSDGTGRYPRRERFLQNLNGDKEIGRSVTTLAGNRPTDNFVLEYGNRRLNETLDKNTVEDKDFIDCYNKKVKKDVAGTITTRVSESNNTFVAVIGNYSPSKHNASRVVDPEGIAPTVMENHGTVTAIPIKNATKKGYLLAEDGDGVDISGRMEYHRGTVQKGLTQTLTTKGGDNNGVVVGLRIRKLTPRECYRLMGWKDTEIDKIQKTGISSAQQYKQAGNGIVVQVLEAIFKKLGETK